MVISPLSQTRASTSIFGLTTLCFSFLIPMFQICIFRLFDNLVYFDVWVRSSAGLRLVSVSRVSPVSESQNQLTEETLLLSLIHI